MILYHGSNVEVQEPKILKNEFGKDFGFAFYLTPIKEQAERMAIRKVKFERCGTPIVSVFEWNKDFSSLKYKKFNEPDMEWLEMIVNCRSNLKYHHDFDIVEGKIADDSVGATVSYVVQGIMRKEDAVERLKFQKINSQVAFCSEQSLKFIKFIKSYEVK